MHSATPLQQQHQNPHEDEDDVDMEESTFVGIEALEQMGVNAGDVQKLRDGGFYTIESQNNDQRRVNAADPVVRNRTSARVWTNCGDGPT